MTEELPEGSEAKPRTASLFASMTPETVSLEEALRLLSLPRVVGDAPDGEEVLARNGRYGPYIEKGKDTRSLEREEQIFEIGLDEALALLAAARSSAGAAARRAPPLRELGDDPVIRAASRRSRTADSARTSPTARRTPACGAATRSSRSPSSGRSSSWPSAAPKGPSSARRRPRRRK